jgi:DNA mismatch repair ATPase MutS
VLGPLLLFDLHVACRLEDWRRISGASVARWLEAVGEIEALGSLANYCHGRPDHVFPEFVAESPCFEADSLGHPLLQSAVTNDVAITGPLQVLIVSGSNMSGKSTFLRTVGVNAVLAQAGGPVFATRLRLSPFSVAASIRILDSLREGRSGFYAEILRLKQIMDTAQDRGPALFLIDEFLHGTNSHDRLVGASAIVRGLVDRGAIGLITTHDLALTNIAASLDSRALNVHFQDYVENGRLHYDYKMRPGVVARSNAIELMRSIGLDV